MPLKVIFGKCDPRISMMSHFLAYGRLSSCTGKSQRAFGESFSVTESRLGSTTADPQGDGSDHPYPNKDTGYCA